MWSPVLCKGQGVDLTEAAPSLGLEKERKMSTVGRKKRIMSLIAPFEKDPGWLEKQGWREQIDACRRKGVVMKIWTNWKEPNEMIKPLLEIFKPNNEGYLKLLCQINNVIDYLCFFLSFFCSQSFHMSLSSYFCVWAFLTVFFTYPFVLPFPHVPSKQCSEYRFNFFSIYLFANPMMSQVPDSELSIVV